MSGSLTLCFFLPQKKSRYKWWMFALVWLELTEIFLEEIPFMLFSFFRTEQSHTFSLTLGLTNVCIVNPCLCLSALQCSLHVGLSHVPAQALIEALPVGRRWLWLWFLFSQMDSSISATGTLLSELPPQQLHCRGADLSESVCRDRLSGGMCYWSPQQWDRYIPRAAGATGFLHLSNSMCPVYGAGGML